MRQGTYGYFYAHEYKVTVYCSPCQRHGEIDLSAVHPDRSRVTFKCSQCGRPGQMSLSPPNGSHKRGRSDSQIAADTERRKEDLRAKWHDAKTLDEDEYQPRASTPSPSARG